MGDTDIHKPLIDNSFHKSWYLSDLLGQRNEAAGPKKIE